MFSELTERLNITNFSMHHSPNLGLFWFDENKTKIILHRYIDARDNSAKEKWEDLLKNARGNPRHDLISVTPRHRELWSKMAEMDLLNKLNLPKEFDELPRGRIYWDEIDKKFVIFYGNWLNEKTYKIILTKFHLNDSDIDLKYGYNPDHYKYKNSEKDLDSLRDFLVNKGVWNDIPY